MSSSTKRVKLVVAYDGTDFCGWAKQRGQRTVHSTLTQIVQDIADEPIELTGASRTDSGAHAQGQVCHFDTTRSIKLGNWVRAINERAPVDLAAASASFVSSEFHARFSAVSRQYRYRIGLGPPDPLRSRFVHHFGRQVDVALMHEAAQTLVGEHDFFAFTQLLGPDEPTRRNVYAITVKQVRDEVWVEVLASAYARGMMRRISGALLEIGRGRRDPASLETLLAQREKNKVPWPVVLPANGLCLMRVRY